MWLLYLCVVLFRLCASDQVDDLRRELRSKPYDYSNSFFGPLLNFYVGGQAATTTQYPWIAKVLHSRSKTYPHVCTASCIEPGIFITAARCLATLKVNYTSIIYAAKRYPVSAFVVPSLPTHQFFDDVGFIVINHIYRTFPGVIKIFTMKRRTGNDFDWFDNNYASFVDKVVGYGLPKEEYRKAKVQSIWDLRALPIIANLEFCPKILQEDLKAPEYRVPCYYSCNPKTVADLSKETCKNFHGIEGSAIISNEKPPRIIGITTWGSFEERRQIELPVGFTVLNSVTFQKDLECAQKVRKADISRMTQGYLQDLCD